MKSAPYNPKVNPQPSNPKSSTPDPKPSTLNPQTGDAYSSVLDYTNPNLRLSGTGVFRLCRDAGLTSQKVFIKSFCKCQFPHRSVNSSFIMTYMKDKLTVYAETQVLAM